MLYNCKLKTAKLSLYCKMRQISSRFFSRKGWQFSRKEFIIFFTYTASYFHVCKFGENFTQRIDFSRTLLKIFSRTGTHFHARKLIFFHARQPVFHGEKKNTVLRVSRYHFAGTKRRLCGSYDGIWRVYRFYGLYVSFSESRKITCGPKYHFAGLGR